MRMKDNFTAGMIHDIRNPLSSMIGSLDYMREHEAILNQPDLCTMLEIATNCSEFIISHVGNFLDIAKMEHSKIELNNIPTELVELLKKIVEMHKFKAEGKNLYLRMNASSNMPELALLD
jgi:signal transduction histidine kinase